MDTSDYLGLFLDESRESLQSLNASLLDLERDPSDPEPLTVIFRVAHSLKGMSAAMGFAAMARLTHRMEEVLAAMRDDGAPVTPAVTDALFACLDTLQEMVDRVAGGDDDGVDAGAVLARLEGIAVGGPAAAGVAVAVAAEGEAAAAVAAAPPAGTARGTDREVRERAAAEDRSPGRVATVRVGTDRLDALMNLMGEMVIQRTRLARLAAEHDLGDLRGAVEDMTRVTDDLRSLIMQVRMMPVGAAFMRFPRMVRDLANTLGKRLDLQISGEDTELDRTVIDGLGDPLVHMLRNAVDHGLESPDERVAAGKDPVGTIRLSARHAGDSVVIEVSDDGRGMDPDALRASVVRKGLMDRAAAHALSDRDALGLVFLPGVSTAVQTTDVSGRGVGMDAVRTAIGDLNGEVTIESAIGRGSVFTIRLPPTLAIIQALLVRAGADLRGGHQVWAVPLDAIEETVVVDPAGTRPVGGRPCMVLRDAVVPLVWLRDCLSLEGGDRDAAAGATIEVVVVRSGEGRMGLVVDGLAGTQDVVIEHLPGFLDDVSGVAGATVLGDGSVALIVDLAALSPAGARTGR